MNLLPLRIEQFLYEFRPSQTLTMSECLFFPNVSNFSSRLWLEPRLEEEQKHLLLLQ